LNFDIVDLTALQPNRARISAGSHESQISRGVKLQQRFRNGNLIKNLLDFRSIFDSRSFVHYAGFFKKAKEKILGNKKISVPYKMKNRGSDRQTQQL
jgi:hypothetical protein